MNIEISSATVYNILNKHQMGTKDERLLKLEAEYLEHINDLSLEQKVLFERFDSGFKDHPIRGNRPGELLVQDAVYVCYSANQGQIYLQTVVDSYSNYAFGFLQIEKFVDFAVSILHNDVIPFFNKMLVPVSAILTDNGRAYCGKENHHFELYLKLKDIEHHRTKNKRSRNGVVKQFIKIATSEFF